MLLHHATGHDLKERRAVATRYEKTARAFLDVLCMAATMDWLKVIKA